MKVNESKFLNAIKGKKVVFRVKMMELLHRHERSGIVIPMLSAFIVLILEFLNVCDER